MPCNQDISSAYPCGAAVGSVSLDARYRPFQHFVPWSYHTACWGPQSAGVGVVNTRNYVSAGTATPRSTRHHHRYPNDMSAGPPVHSDPDPQPARVSIRSLYATILTTFSRLQKELQRSGTQIKQQLPEAALEDEIGRFRLWAGNSGAHRKGRISLDHKLRYATHVHDKVTQLLRQLDGALHAGNRILEVLDGACLVLTNPFSY